MISRSVLEEMYINRRLSMMEISIELGCSQNKVVYWMDRYGIQRRDTSEAIYQKHNPNGDPFTLQPIRSKADAELLGMGLGLYWGEGNKANIHSVRLGNSDPELIRTFMRFLIELFGVKKEKFKFGLQIFTDIDPGEALEYWVDELGVNPWQFGKVIVTISGSIGTYRKKSKYGVLTVHFNNKKLRDIIIGMLPG